MITLTEFPQTRREVISLLGMTLREMNGTLYDEYIIAIEGPSYTEINNIAHYIFELRSGKRLGISDLDSIIIVGEPYFTIQENEKSPQKIYDDDCSRDRCFCQM